MGEGGGVEVKSGGRGGECVLGGWVGGVGEWLMMMIDDDYNVE